MRKAIGILILLALFVAFMWVLVMMYGFWTTVIGFGGSILIMGLIGLAISLIRD